MTSEAGRSSLDTPKRRRRIEFLVIAVCILMPIVWYSWRFLTSENFGKPLGRDRVAHSQGFFLVYPSGREVSVSLSVDNSINGYPGTLVSTCYSVMIYVEERGSDVPAGPSDGRPVKFQNQPAYECIPLVPGDWERLPCSATILSFPIMDLGIISSARRGGIAVRRRP